MKEKRDARFVYSMTTISACSIDSSLCDCFRRSLSFKKRVFVYVDCWKRRKNLHLFQLALAEPCARYCIAFGVVQLAKLEAKNLYGGQPVLCGCWQNFACDLLSAEALNLHYWDTVDGRGSASRFVLAARYLHNFKNIKKTTFLAFKLWSSVVSVLFTLNRGTSSTARHWFNLIFEPRIGFSVLRTWTSPIVTIALHYLLCVARWQKN